MRKLFFLLFFFPLLSVGQPFHIKECRVRPIFYNDSAYSDIHLVLISKRDKDSFYIDSLTFNNINSQYLQMSVLGKALNEKNYQKNDSLLFQCHTSYIEKPEESEIRLYYHFAKKPKKNYAVRIKKIRILKQIDIQQY
ncbi:MAG: hypothetical protein CVU05_10895 [Bacteroidetes bacterium HGW-Bacteroidetes-21]|nr:MAG: hypothetical protein CVU05_10895 [Bacteroidetes bacterium HGW-Bacteroidetes-21]